MPPKSLNALWPGSSRRKVAHDDAESSGEQASSSVPATLLPFSFGAFRAYPAQNELQRLDTGERQRLEPRTMDVLVVLARNAGEVVSRQAFSETIWPGRRVVDDSLSVCVSELRRALKDSARAPQYIRTVPKRGYCLLAAVSWEQKCTSDLQPLPQTRTRTSPVNTTRALLGSAAVIVIVALVLSRLLSDTVSTAESANDVPIQASAVNAQQLMPLLSTSAGERKSIVRWSSSGPAAAQYRIERSWLDDGHVRLELRDDTEAVVWSVERAITTEQERRAVVDELVASVALTDKQEAGPLLQSLPPLQQRLFKRARHHMDRRTEADLIQARELLDQLLAYDPEFVEAILSLAELQRSLSRYDRSVEHSAAYRAAHDALVERAVQIAPEHPAVRALTYTPGNGKIDWQRYEDELRALVTEAPDCAACVRRLAEFYLQVGWLEEAIAVWEAHQRYWPLSASVHATLGLLYTQTGNAAKALQQVALIRALAGNANAWDVHAAEANAYQMLGDRAEWIDSLTALLSDRGEMGELRLALYKAIAADDEAQLAQLARWELLLRDFNIALTLGQIEPLLARIKENTARGEYRDLGLIHGWTFERNALNRRYLDGLARLQREPQIQALFERIGLRDFWRDRERLPDYCKASTELPPHCS